MSNHKKNSFYNRAQSLSNQKIDTGNLRNEKIYAQYGLLGKKNQRVNSPTSSSKVSGNSISNKPAAAGVN